MCRLMVHRRPITCVELDRQPLIGNSLVLDIEGCQFEERNRIGWAIWNSNRVASVSSLCESHVLDADFIANDLILKEGLVFERWRHRE